MSAKIAINGFGRIGRALARLIILQAKHELVAINELGDADTSAYLLKYDSIHKKLDLEVRSEKDAICVADKKIKYFSCKKIEDVDFDECDIIFECSGVHKDSVSFNLDPKKKIVIASMPRDDTPVFIYGLSDKEILKNRIISAGSCSTNALSLILHSIEESFKIESGSVTSVHSYMADQNLLDSRSNRCLRSSRAAALNIIPVSTGVSRNLLHSLPHLADKFIGFSVRVPVADVAMLDITISLQKSATISQINEIFIKKSKTTLSGVLDVDFNSRVSSDFISNKSSVVVALDLTQKISENQFKIIAWFDNEVGYASRLYDLISLIKGEL